MASNMTFGLVQNEKPKTFDASRFYDPDRHPLRKVYSGKLYTIDRGYRYKPENRYWTATDTLGSDGLAGKIATLYSNGSGYGTFEIGYDKGEKIQKSLGLHETVSLAIPGNKWLQITRVR